MNHWPTCNVKYLGEFYDVSVNLEERILVSVEQNGKNVWDELDQKDRHWLELIGFREVRERAEDARAEAMWEGKHYGR